MIKYEKITYKRNDFCLQINEMEIKVNEKVAILGENGCGKSTFINLSCGLLGNQPIFYRTKKLKNMDIADRAQMFALFTQNPQTAFPFTVFDIVRMGRYSATGGRYVQQDSDKTFEMMTLFDITRLREKKFSELSGGEQRRVMLARTFNQDTPYIFLDEPVSMLDIRHSLDIMNIIEDSSKTVIASMHDINLAKRHFTRLLMMKEGAIIYDISPKELMPEIIEEVYNVKVSTDISSYSFVI